jgi:hypothetical protein
VVVRRAWPDRELAVIILRLDEAPGHSDMSVSVNQPGHDGFASPVNDGCTLRHRDRSARSNRFDAISPNDQDAIFHCRGTRAIPNPRPFDSDRRRSRIGLNSR